MSLFHLTVAGIGVLMVAVLHILFKPASEDKETKTHTHTATKTTKPVSKFASIHFTQCPFLTKHLFPKLVLLKSSFWRQEGKRTKRKGGKEKKEQQNWICFTSGWGQSVCCLDTVVARTEGKKNLPLDLPARLYTIKFVAFSRFQKLVCDESSNLLLCVLAFPQLGSSACTLLSHFLQFVDISLSLYPQHLL